jgi:hypothetical protein
MLIIPLSVDGTVPQGLLGHIQSIKIDPNSPSEYDLYAALAKLDSPFVIDRLIDRVAASRPFASAEHSFSLLIPFLAKANDQQIVRLLEQSEHNTQIKFAGLCASKYLPPLMKTHGHLLPETTRKSPAQTHARYAPKT